MPPAPSQVKDVKSQAVLAAKHIRTRSTEQKERVKEEIGIMRRLANPNVIKFVDAFENSREIILGTSLPHKLHITPDFNHRY